MNDNKRFITRSTLFLRLTIIGIGLAVLGVCGLLLTGLTTVHLEYPAFAAAVYAVLGAVFLTTIPYYYALSKAWSVLGLIDAGKVFTFQVVRKLRIIARCAAAIGIIYFLSLPAFYIWADLDDAPGLVVIGMVFTVVPIVLAVCAAVLQRILHEAIIVKDENDLTV